MVSKIFNVIHYGIYGLFFIVFSYLLINILFHNSVYNYEKILLFPLIVLFLFLLYRLYLFIAKKETFIVKHSLLILCVFILCMFVVQTTMGFFLQFSPAFDLEAVYGGAVEFAEKGSFQNHYQYFYYFPHNLGAMFFLGFFFKIASLLYGIRNYFHIAMVINSILSISAMITVFHICKKLFGIKQAIFSLALFGLSLPFYLIAPVFYTDALSHLFPALYFLLYLKLSENKIPAVFLFLLLGLTACIGMMIKFTVVFIVIAVAIDMLLKKNFKKFVISHAIILSVIISGFAAFNGYIYSSHLDKTQAERYNTPYTHWIMMGLNNGGGYNPHDYDLTRSFATMRERRNANITEIIKRAQNFSEEGMLNHLTIKAVKCFGDGTFAFSDFLDDTPLQIRSIHSFMLYSGKYYYFYRHICEAMFVCIFILLLSSVFGSLFTSEKNPLRMNVPIFSLCLLLFFLIIWETSGRYSFNYITMFIVGAAGGIDYFIQSISEKKKSLAANISQTGKDE